MIIGIPAECQNGHKAIWKIQIVGLDVIVLGVDKKEKCNCPKLAYGQGYHAIGKPFIVDNGVS